MQRNIYIAFFLLFALPVSLRSNGWITVRSSVLGADVTVDETQQIRMHVKEMCFAVDEGLHLVIVDREGYRPKIDTVTVHTSENVLLPVWLEPMTKKTIRQTSTFKSTSWDYQLTNGLFNIRWAAIGGGLGTGLNVHVSLFDIRYGLFTIEPCLWGMNVPFYSGLSHVPDTWLIHPRDRRSENHLYETAIPSSDLQFYYTPLVGVQLPMTDRMAFVMSAGPQISWTHTHWTCQWRELPLSYAYVFTEQPFPQTGYQFDPVWFSAQIGIMFTGVRSDLLTYFKYQDGYFLGLEYRF